MFTRRFVFLIAFVLAIFSGQAIATASTRFEVDYGGDIQVTSCNLAWQASGDVIIACDLHLALYNAPADFAGVPVHITRSNGYVYTAGPNHWHNDNGKWTWVMYIYSPGPGEVLEEIYIDEDAVGLNFEWTGFGPFEVNEDGTGLYNTSGYMQQVAYSLVSEGFEPVNGLAKYSVSVSPNWVNHPGTSLSLETQNSSCGEQVHPLEEGMWDGRPVSLSYGPLDLLNSEFGTWRIVFNDPWGGTMLWDSGTVALPKCVGPPSGVVMP